MHLARSVLYAGEGGGDGAALSHRGCVAAEDEFVCAAGRRGGAAGEDHLAVCISVISGGDEGCAGAVGGVRKGGHDGGVACLGLWSLWEVRYVEQAVRFAFGMETAKGLAFRAFSS